MGGGRLPAPRRVEVLQGDRHGYRKPGASDGREPGACRRCPAPAWFLRLASAVGYGRLLTESADVAAALPLRSDCSLRSTASCSDLARALDWDGCLRRIAAALKHGRSEHGDIPDSSRLRRCGRHRGRAAGQACADAEALIPGCRLNGVTRRHAAAMPGCWHPGEPGAPAVDWERRTPPSAFVAGDRTGCSARGASG